MRTAARGNHHLWKQAGIVLGGLLLTAATCQAQTCLHGLDESRDEHARRDAAIRFVHQVNDAEASLQLQHGKFRRLHELTGVDPPPVGFVPRMTIDDWSYVIIVKDGFDACGFSVFSDQDGVIYEARPVNSGKPIGVRTQAERTNRKQNALERNRSRSQTRTRLESPVHPF